MDYQLLLQTASDTLGINEAKTCRLGGTIIDIDETAGYTNKAGQMTSLRKPDQVFSCPNDALAFYPLIEQAERENNNPTDNMRVLSGMWTNGFIPHGRGMTEPEFASQEAAKIMVRYGAVTVNQVFGNRADSVIATFYTFFKWFGGTDSDRILPKEVADDASIGMNIRRGIVCGKWAIKPISIRYVVKIRGNATTLDYAYFVGGSPELLTDNMEEVANLIGTMFRSAKALRDGSQKTANIPRDVLNNDAVSSPFRVWYEYDENDYNQETRNHDLSKSRLLMKKINRMCQGIIFIRNYFHYAKRFNGITTVADFNLNVSKVPTEVSIDKLIDKYEDIYQYVRNICRIYPEIGAGKIDEA